MMKQECPYCKSQRVIKNGTTRHGKQNHKCKDCDRQFVSNPRNQPIPEATKQLVDKLLLERMSLRAITRVAGVSLQWVQSYVNSKSRTIEQQVKVIPKKKSASHY